MKFTKEFIKEQLREIEELTPIQFDSLMDVIVNFKSKTNDIILQGEVVAHSINTSNIRCTIIPQFSQKERLIGILYFESKPSYFPEDETYICWPA